MLFLGGGAVLCLLCFALVWFVLVGLVFGLFVSLCFWGRGDVSGGFIVVKPCVFENILFSFGVFSDALSGFTLHHLTDS